MNILGNLESNLKFMSLLSVGSLLCFSFPLRADPPIFADDKDPTSNIYDVDGLVTSTWGSDFRIRRNLNAPFPCKTMVQCPSSIIIENKTGTVNLPVDVNIGTLYVAKTQVIDSTGKWVGSPTGLIGPKGDTGPQGLKGAAGVQGPIGSKGDTGLTGAQGLTGPKGDTGLAGAQGLTGPKGDTGLAGAQGLTGPKGDTGLTGAQGLTGPAGPIGPGGPKGDTGIGLQGPKGEKGDGCTISDFGDVVCGSSAPINVIGPQGPKGSLSSCAIRYSEKTSIFGNRYSAASSCFDSELMTGGGCSVSNLELDYSAPLNTGKAYSCTGNQKDSSKPSTSTAIAICCTR